VFTSDFLSLANKIQNPRQQQISLNK